MRRVDELHTSKHFMFRDNLNLSKRDADIHYHSFFEIYSLTDGKCDGFVDDKFYTFQIGDVVLIPPGAIHSTHYSTERHGRTLVNFTLHMIPKALVEVISRKSFIYRCEETQEEVRRIFEAIGLETQNQDDFCEEAISALLTRLIIMIVRHAREDDVEVAKNTFAEKAVRYVQKNYQNPLSLEEIARECNVSKVHLSRKFKEMIGIGLNEYISMYRLKKAKELLLMQDKRTICEVAFDCGFNDSNYFSWLFKKTYGVTPSQYKKNTQK